MIDMSDVMLVVGTLVLALGIYLGLGLAAGVSVVGLGLLVAGVLRGVSETTIANRILRRGR